MKKCCYEKELMSCPNVTEKGIDNLSKTLQNLQNLKSVNFKLAHCLRLGDAALDFLSQNLSLMKSLQYLSLDFEFNLTPCR